MSSLKFDHSVWILQFFLISFCISCTDNSDIPPYFSLGDIPLLEEYTDIETFIDDEIQDHTNTYENDDDAGLYYQLPEPDDIQLFNEAMELLLAHQFYDYLNFVGLNGDTGILGYKTRLINQNNKRYILFFEDRTTDFYVLGWGTYIINFDYVSKVIIEAPHIKHDYNTSVLAARIFIESDAFALLIAGAHRQAYEGDYNGRADVANSNFTYETHDDKDDDPQTIFQAMHISLLQDEGSGCRAIQIHGFTGSHLTYPDTKAVLSNGYLNNTVKADISTFSIEVYDSLTEYGIKTELFAAPEDLLPNTYWGASHNVQGHYANNTFGAGAFVHIELVYSVRTEDQQISTFAESISQAVR